MRIDTEILSRGRGTGRAGRVSSDVRERGSLNMILKREDIGSFGCTKQSERAKRGYYSL